MSITSENVETVEVFYSYAHEDERLRKLLDKQLSLLKRQGLITESHDHKIAAGEDLDSEIQKHLNSAQIILLLISPDFIASDYCYSVEMQRAMERHESGEARVIPVLLRPSDWKKAPFGKLKPLPSDGKAVTRWTNRDEAFLNIAKSIRGVVKEFTTSSIVLAKPTISPSSSKNTIKVDSEVSLPIWNVPYKRNVFFTGREEILEQLHDTFTRGKGKASRLPQALSGLGGVGKTQTAIEYTYRYRNEYQTILWARAESQDVLMADLATIAQLLSLPEKDTKEQLIIIDGIKDWLNNHNHWLLVLDNVEDLEMITNFISSDGKGHVLLTTREQAMSGWAQRVRIETMTPEEGALLLLRRANFIAQDALLDEVSDADLTKAEEISRTLDGLPLGLDQAGAYIEETELGLAGYFNLYQTQQQELLKRRGRQSGSHPEPVATTWTLSFERVQRANAVAADILQLCAFLYPDAIPEEIISEGISDVSRKISPLATNTIQFNEAIEELLKFSLVRRDPTARTLTLHRLVQMALKDAMDESTQQLWIEQAVKATNSVFPNGDFTTWSLCQKYFAHALQCRVLIDQKNLAFKEAAHLLYKVSYYLWERNQYKQAEPFLLDTLAIREKVLGLENLDVAQTLNLLGVICLDEDKNIQAKLYLERALAIREKLLGYDHPQVAESLHDLAITFDKLGEVTQAEHLIQKAIAIREKVLGKEHIVTSRSISMLGYIYQTQGKYALSEQLYRQSLATCENVLGPDHPDIALRLNSLGSLMTLLDGRHSEAKLLYQRALAIIDKTVGREDILAASTLDNIATSLVYEGKYIQARTYANRGLKLRERSLGPNHNSIAASLTTLAITYQGDRNYPKAEQFFQRALLIVEKVYSHEHYEVANLLNLGSNIYLHQGKYRKAEVLYQRAIGIYEKLFGGEYHPKLVTILHKYAHLLQLTKRKTEAAQLEARIEAMQAKSSQENRTNSK